MIEEIWKQWTNWKGRVYYKCILCDPNLTDSEIRASYSCGCRHIIEPH